MGTAEKTANPNAVVESAFPLENPVQLVQIFRDLVQKSDEKELLSLLQAMKQYTIKGTAFLSHPVSRK